MAKGKEQTQKGAGKSLQDFRASYDPEYIVPRKIEAALAALGESWETETEFARRADVGTTNLSRFRAQYEDYTVQIGGRNSKFVWAGTKEFAARLRECRR